MPEYVYRNAAGETRSIHARMSDPPPELVVFNPDGSWEPFTDSGYDRHRAAEAYRRVYGNCQLNTDPVTKRWGFESRTLPRTLPDSLAEKSPRGLPIVRNKEHAKQLAEYTGMVMED